MDDTFAVCPVCERKQNPFPSRPLKVFKKDEQLDIIIKCIITDVDVAAKETFISNQLIENTCFCSICLSVFDRTVVTKCLHRFCRGCIVRSLGTRSACKKTCPLCKGNIASTRALYADEMMDLLIDLYHNENQSKPSGNKKPSNNGKHLEFNLILKPYPRSLRTSHNQHHLNEKIYLKITTPNITTGMYSHPR